MTVLIVLAILVWCCLIIAAIIVKGILWLAVIGAAALVVTVFAVLVRSNR